MSTSIVFNGTNVNSQEEADGSNSHTTVSRNGQCLWQHDGWIGGWNRADSDVFYLAADVDGDEFQEILIINNTSLWTGILKWSGTELDLTWASGSPIDGWHRSPNDAFYSADVDRDGCKEIIVANNSDGWTGVLKWVGGSMSMAWASASPIDGWVRGVNDQFNIADIDQDGFDEVVLANLSDGWIGGLKWQNGGMHIVWDSASPINGPAGSIDLRHYTETNVVQNDEVQTIQLIEQIHHVNGAYTDGDTAMLGWVNGSLQTIAINEPVQGGY